MIIDENKISLARDIVFNSSDIETINAINYLKIIKKFKEELNNNKYNIKQIDKFINECILKYIEIREIIQNSLDNKIYLYKKDYYLQRLSNIELGIYTHILLIKGKIEEIYEIMYIK